jgi:hypothetical protein
MLTLNEQRNLPRPEDEMPSGIGSFNIHAHFKKHFFATRRVCRNPLFRLIKIFHNTGDASNFPRDFFFPGIVSLQDGRLRHARITAERRL